MSRQMGWEAARDYLRKMREDQVRDGEAAVQLWEEVLRDNATKLGDEMWTVQEQVAIAALDCQKFDVSTDCIRSLSRKFPKSRRVARILGMLNEAQEDYEEAKVIYEQILEEDETNMFVRKRMIAIEKAQNNTPKAIELLAEYLKTFMTDFDAWLELCDLYLQQQDYKKAEFCMEELIMSNPNNHLFYQKFAEIKYTEGGQENLEMARAYFAQAAKLNPNSMRAQFGLLLTASNLATGFSQKSQKDRHSNNKYAAWAAKQITDKYKMEQSPEQLNETKVLDFLNKILESVSASH